MREIDGKCVTQPAKVIKSITTTYRTVGRNSREVSKVRDEPPEEILSVHRGGPSGGRPSKAANQGCPAKCERGRSQFLEIAEAGLAVVDSLEGRRTTLQ